MGLGFGLGWGAGLEAAAWYTIQTPSRINQKS